MKLGRPTLSLHWSMGLLALAAGGRVRLRAAGHQRQRAVPAGLPAVHAGPAAPPQEGLP
jgi:hypothetical protein